VEEVGVATSSDFNGLVCPAGPNGPSDVQRQFSELSSLSGVSRIPPAISIAIPTITKKNGRRFAPAAEKGFISVASVIKHTTDSGASA
jgi:hypothetical protein